MVETCRAQEIAFDATLEEGCPIKRNLDCWRKVGSSKPGCFEIELKDFTKIK